MTDRSRVFACPDHAPAGHLALSNDDGQPTCDVVGCGKRNYAVKPYALRTWVYERGYWVTDAGVRCEIR